LVVVDANDYPVASATTALRLDKDDVRVGRDRLLGETEDLPVREGRDASKATFTMERTGVAAMALGIIERCLELCVPYAKERVQFGQPIGRAEGLGGCKPRYWPSRPRSPSYRHRRASSSRR